MTKEYGDIVDGDMAVRTTLENSGPYRLTHSTAGYELAGSCTRSTDEKWGVLWTLDGCRMGQWFRTLAEAEVFFAERK